MLRVDRHRHTLFLVLILILLCFLQTVAQAEEAADEAADSDAAATETIRFEGTEDSSLFVGFYRLNPGDRIRVEIITDRVLSHDAMLDDEGYIVLPVVGPAPMADLTLGEAREALQELVDRYYQRAWVTCRVIQLGRVKFFIYGDIEEPGFYTATGATTFFDFLQLFELASDPAHRRIVHVRGRLSAALPEPNDSALRDEEATTELIARSFDLLAAGEADKIDPSVTVIDPLVFTLEGEIEERNFYLEYGDVIYVPDPEVSVSLTGFRRSGDYEVLPGETLADIVRIAGGPDLLSDVSSMILERRDDQGRLTRMYYNLNYLDDEALAKIPLENRDFLNVVGIEGNVYVLGAVNEAGVFPYRAVGTPMDYLAEAGGPTEDAHLRFVVIVRPPRDPGAPLEESTLIRCDLVESLLTGAPPIDVAMEPGDILFVPDKGERLTLGSILSGLSVLINALRLFD